MDSTTPKSTSITQSRFGFLSALTTRLTSQSPVTPLSEEEILNLNVEAALYPSMSPSERDTFSPAAYKNLQINATGLVLKMQSAYRERTTAFQEIQAERSVEKEEAEEINMRVESLKMQLEHMASKAAEQEQAMQQLMRELKAEKKARIEERLTREKLLAEGPIVNEDLGVDEAERQKWRKSGLTVKSDVSFDTDEESAESESVFSRSRSPTIMTSARESTIDLPTVQPGKTASMEATPKSKTAKEMTTFQKLFKGISGDTTKDDGGLGADGCKNCRGRDSSVAWDTVSLLRDENRGLKHRVADLEVAVDGALDVVNGIGL
ncbi:uncharacterized protein BCR38DRAFT_334064 [Pseudomassariella vexata]|uniref:Uncharacterized protein n=1 Tax=Pseudomassariella vexata TaxID=1141098 RepID=A0A1Y2EFN8_9PEZI|nr:uncharacterized protein BCR38DRAFT_334064 [Pseudomassariella vexata]ORY70076.1 hypothetical protein BCR38DRAFT_334064 [Pseudomassariella vexata]